MPCSTSLSTSCVAAGRETPNASAPRPAPKPPTPAVPDGPTPDPTPATTTRSRLPTSPGPCPSRPARFCEANYLIGLIAQLSRYIVGLSRRFVRGRWILVTIRSAEGFGRRGFDGKAEGGRGGYGASGWPLGCEQEARAGRGAAPRPWRPGGGVSLAA